MRKLIRSILRAEGERKGVKASRYVSREFDDRQIKKYGVTVRRINQAKGTRKRKLWKQNVKLAIELI